jgi:hypothetical protein
MKLPSTMTGWWALGLGIAFIVLFSINTFVFIPLQMSVPWQLAMLPFYGIFMLLSGLASSVAGLVAIIAKKERSVFTWLTLLPGAFVVFFLLGEFLIPH